MKKIISLVLITVLSIVCVSVLASCSTEIVPPAHEHTYAASWSSNDTHHWYAATCEHTTEVYAKAEHSYDVNGSCVCGKTRGHQHTYATDWSYDETGHWYAANCDHTEEKLGVAAHIIDDNGACVCGYVAEHTHSYSSDWTYDETNHWHAATCGDTDEVIGLSEHVAGSDGACTVCGYFEHVHTYSPDWESDEDGHWHEATCDHDVAGNYSEHYYNDDGVCTVCGYEQDADHVHTYSTEWTVTSARHWHEATCGHNIRGSQANHTYDENGTCTVCDYTSHEHTYATAWSSNATHHWQAATCDHTDEIRGYAAHSFGADNVCTVCDVEKTHVHSYETEWTYDETNHWYASACGHTAEIAGLAAHTFDVNNECIYCDYVIPHTHSFSTEWTYDSEGHWHEALCDDTEQTAGYGAHENGSNGSCIICSYKSVSQDFYDLANNANPSRVVTVIQYVTAAGESLPGEYIMEKSGNNLIITYNYQRLSTPAEALEEGCGRIKTVSGTVYYRDGLYSTDGYNWEAQAPTEANIKFDLREEYLTNPSVNEDDTILTATVTPENAINMFGTDLSAAEDIDFVVITNGVNLTRIDLSCTTTGGATVSVITSYSYNNIELVFPDEEQPAPPAEESAIQDFVDAIENTNPGTVSIDTKLETTLTDTPLTGKYIVVYNEDGTATVTYTYIRFYAIGEGNGTDDIFETVSGTVTIDADGNVTDGDGAEVGAVVAASAINFNLDESKFENYTVASGILTADIAAENTADVLGTAIDSDAKLSLTVVNGAIVSATITYTTAEGPATIICTYR